MNWETIFDEKHPNPGASDAVIERLIAQVAEPMSAAEIRVINEGQRNPFPDNDPLYNTWQPIDAAKWVIPDRPLPESYRSLLRWSNGGEFRTGERWFQFFPALDESTGVRAMMLAYQIPEYMPGAVPIAFDGGGTFYLFDMRRSAVRGEYPIVLAHAGSLSWDPDDYTVIAKSLVKACQCKD